MRGVCFYWQNKPQKFSFTWLKLTLQIPHFQTFITKEVEGRLSSAWDQGEVKIQFSASGKSVCSPVRKPSKRSSQSVKRLPQITVRLWGQRELSTCSSCIINIPAVFLNSHNLVANLAWWYKSKMTEMLPKKLPINTQKMLSLIIYLVVQNSRCGEKERPVTYLSSKANNWKNRFKACELCKVMATENTTLLSHWPMHSVHKIKQNISNCCANTDGWSAQGIPPLLKWPALRVQLQVRSWKAISTPSYKVLIWIYFEDCRALVVSLLL